MLLGHNDEYKDDVNMRATVAYNKFGSGLIQRLPRLVAFGCSLSSVSNACFLPFACLLAFS